MENNFILIWPNGIDDSPSEMRAWNVSQSVGPKGPICIMDREGWEIFECHYSCPLCDELHSCDWSSCYDDIGYLEFLIAKLGQEWCLDLDHLHFSGISNGALVSFRAANSGFDSLGNNF